MSTQDNTEKVLRSLHVLLSKSEPYPKEPSKVIVNKQEMLDLLGELNKCIYDIMEDYELTKQSRSKAERQFRKKGDDIVWDASRKAEDIYAASVMYTDEALNSVNEMIGKTNDSIMALYKEMNQKIEEQQRTIRKNQLELKSQLQDLVDTEKYLKLIEERNREREKEKRENAQTPEEVNLYADRKTEIKINKEFFAANGYALDDEPEAKEEVKAPEIKVDLDAEYFAWKESEGKGEEKKAQKESKPLSDELSKVWKNFTTKNAPQKTE